MIELCELKMGAKSTGEICFNFHSRTDAETIVLNLFKPIPILQYFRKVVVFILENRAEGSI